MKSIRRMMSALQSEYRWQFNDSWIFTGFAGFGEVAETFGDFRNNLLPAAGIRTRFILSRKHRVGLAADIAVGNDGTEFYLETGVPGAADLTAVSFYTNDFETTTQGIDVVATWAVDFGGAGNGTLTAAWNWTDTEVDRIGSEVSRNRVVDLENFNPESRGIFTYNHFVNNFRFLVRASFYGEWVNSGFSGDPTWGGAGVPVYNLDCAGVPNAGGGIDYNDECYDSDWIFDIEGAYTFADKYTVVLGVQNVADNFGPRDKDNLDGTIGIGSAYELGNPFGYEGGFWYLRLRADFE